MFQSSEPPLTSLADCTSSYSWCLHAKCPRNLHWFFKFDGQVSHEDHLWHLNLLWLVEPYFSFAIGLCEQEAETIPQVLLGNEVALSCQPWRVDCDVSLEVRIAPWLETGQFEGLQGCQNEVTKFHNVRTVRQQMYRHEARPTLDYWLILSRCRTVTQVLLPIFSQCLIRMLHSIFDLQEKDGPFLTMTLHRNCLFRAF